MRSRHHPKRSKKKRPQLGRPPGCDELHWGDPQLDAHHSALVLSAAWSYRFGRCSEMRSQFDAVGWGRPESSELKSLWGGEEKKVEATEGGEFDRVKV